MASSAFLAIPLEVIDMIIEEVIKSPTAQPSIGDKVETQASQRTVRRGKGLALKTELRKTNPNQSNNCAGLFLANRFLHERTKSAIARITSVFELYVNLTAKATNSLSWTRLPHLSPQGHKVLQLTLRIKKFLDQPEQFFLSHMLCEQLILPALVGAWPGSLAGQRSLLLPIDERGPTIEEMILPSPTPNLYVQYYTSLTSAVKTLFHHNGSEDMVSHNCTLQFEDGASLALRWCGIRQAGNPRDAGYHQTHSIAGTYTTPRDIQHVIYSEIQGEPSLESVLFALKLKQINSRHL